jgi:hypothetical protein
MNYFTPERLARLGNLENEQAFLAALQEWDQAAADYNTHLKQIKKQVPRSLFRVLGVVSLHDARVLSMLQDQKRFIITLQPLSDPDHLVVLFYDLAEDPHVVPDALPDDLRHEPLQWMYSELNLDRPESPRGVQPPASGKPTFRHNILLSNGWEIELRFNGASALRPIRVLPEPAKRSDGNGAPQRTASPSVGTRGGRGSRHRRKQGNK